MFCKETRLNHANRADHDFNGKTHMNTAYKKLAIKMESDFDDGDPMGPRFIGKPQEVVLPFLVKKRSNGRSPIIDSEPRL